MPTAHHNEDVARERAWRKIRIQQALASGAEITPKLEPPALQSLTLADIRLGSAAFSSSASRSRKTSSLKGTKQCKTPHRK